MENADDVLEKLIEKQQFLNAKLKALEEELKKSKSSDNSQLQNEINDLYKKIVDNEEETKKYKSRVDQRCLKHSQIINEIIEGQKNGDKVINDIGQKQILELRKLHLIDDVKILIKLADFSAASEKQIDLSSDELVNKVIVSLYDRLYIEREIKFLFHVKDKKSDLEAKTKYKNGLIAIFNQMNQTKLDEHTFNHHYLVVCCLLAQIKENSVFTKSVNDFIAAFAINHTQQHTIHHHDVLDVGVIEGNWLVTTPSEKIKTCWTFELNKDELLWHIKDKNGLYMTVSDEVSRSYNHAQTVSKGIGNGFRIIPCPTKSAFYLYHQAKAQYLYESKHEEFSAVALIPTFHIVAAITASKNWYVKSAAFQDSDVSYEFYFKKSA